MPRGRTAATIEALFERHTQFDPNSGCWLWQGQSAGAGYGLVRGDGGRKRLTHRVAYERVHGPIPARMFVCHRCDTPACVNPSHLFLGSAADNARDMVAKGRKALRRGADNPFATLEEAQVREIAKRLLAGASCASIARDLAVSKHAVGQIKRGRSWRHVTGFEVAPPLYSRPDKRPLRSRGFGSSRSSPPVETDAVGTQARSAEVNKGSDQ